MPDSDSSPDIFGALPDEPDVVSVAAGRAPVPMGALQPPSPAADTSASPEDVLAGLTEPEVVVALGPVGKRYALLVGVNKYDLADMPPLKYAVSDVEALQQKLVEYGFDVTCLHDRTAKKPSRGNVLGELARIIAISQPEDLVLVHFSCHGKARDGQNYLLLSDTHLGESLAETALTVEKVKNTMRREGKARRLMLMLDACQSGGGGREVMDAEDHTAFLETAVHVNGGAGKPLDKSLPMRDAYLHAEGFAVLAGCDSRQIAHEPDDLGHGVFTHFILQALDPESAVVDAGTQLVTSDRLATFVERGVSEWWRKRGLDPQKPVRDNSAGLALADLTLVRARPQAHPPRARPVPAEVPGLQVRYNQIRQKSSRTAYHLDEGIYDQLLYWRIRSLEFTLQKRKPLKPGLSGNWYIFKKENPSTSVNKLTDVLTVLRGFSEAVPRHEVTTVFLDLRDDFDSDRTPDQLDLLLRAELGERLFTPADLSPQSSDLQAAVATGWPLLEELRGKFVFVLTGGRVASAEDRLNHYVEGGSKAHQRVAFIAPELRSAQEIQARKDVIFFDLSSAQVTSLGPVIFQAGLVCRVNDVDREGQWRNAVNSKAHLLSTTQVNSRKHSWSRTDNRQGWPFQGIEAELDSGAMEPGPLISVQVKSRGLTGTQDSFGFHYNEGVSDGTIEMFIASPATEVDERAKGALMARASLADDAPYFAVVRPARNKLCIQYREATGKETRILSDADLVPENSIDAASLGFVKLELAQGGQLAQGWGSADGKEWRSLGSYQFKKENGSPIQLRYLGLAVSSNDESRPARFCFFPMKGPSSFEKTANVGRDVSEGEP